MARVMGSAPGPSSKRRLLLYGNRDLIQLASFTAAVVGPTLRSFIVPAPGKVYVLAAATYTDSGNASVSIYKNSDIQYSLTGPAPWTLRGGFSSPLSSFAVATNDLVSVTPTAGASFVIMEYEKVTGSISFLNNPSSAIMLCSMLWGTTFRRAHVKDGESLDGVADPRLLQYASAQDLSIRAAVNLSSDTGASRAPAIRNETDVVWLYQGLTVGAATYQHGGICYYDYGQNVITAPAGKNIAARSSDGAGGDRSTVGTYGVTIILEKM